MPFETPKHSPSNLDILAFGAHPDDAEAGCGGFLIKSAHAGKRIGVIDMSQAELSTNGDVELRKKEATAAAKIIGVSVRENLGLPNNFFFNSKEAQERIIDTIRHYCPETVLLPYWIDRHPDHETVKQIVYPALFTAGLSKFKTERPPHRPTRLLFYRLWFDFSPSFILDISNEMETKVRAMLSYESQFIKQKESLPTKDNTEDFLEYWRAWHRVNGYKIGVKYGEPYLSLTPVGLDDVAAMLPNYS